MNYFPKIFILLSIFIYPYYSVSAEWEPLGKMNMGGMNVTIFVDKSSIAEDKEINEFKMSWVKFELPKNTDTELSDKAYRSREELYYFHCGQELYLVSHVKLLDDKDEVIFDSGAYNPYSDELKESWKLITPLSGPDLINTYVCKLDQETNKSASDSPKWMRSKETPEISIIPKMDGDAVYSVKEVRWAMRDGGMERVVFDIYSGKEKAPKPENFEVIDEARDNKMDILFRNYENTGTNLPDLGQSKLIKEIIVSKDEVGQGVNVEILLKNYPSYEIIEVENPGRLVIDFKTGEASP